MGEETAKNKLFMQLENGAYKEVGILTLADIEIDDIEEYKNIIMDTQGEFECIINDKDTIRKLKQLAKTDKDKKAEKRFNKKRFRNFISNI